MNGWLIANACMISTAYAWYKVLTRGLGREDFTHDLDIDTLSHFLTLYCLGSSNTLPHVHRTYASNLAPWWKPTTDNSCYFIGREGSKEPTDQQMEQTTTLYGGPSDPHILTYIYIYIYIHTHTHTLKMILIYCLVTIGMSNAIYIVLSNLCI